MSERTTTGREALHVEGETTSPETTTPISRHQGIACCHVFVLLLSISLLIAASIDFRGTWDRACDYQLKVWVEVTLARFTAHYSFLIILLRLKVKGYDKCTKPFFLLINLSDLFNLCWFLYGIKPVLVDGTFSCNVNSKRWGVALWSIEAIVTIVPCILLLCCLPILWCLFIRTDFAGPPEAEPTPPEVLNKLEVKKFREVRHRLSSTGDPQTLTPPPLERTRSDVGVGGTIQQATSNIRNLTGLPLPMPELRRMQSARTAGPPPSALAPLSQQPSTVVGRGVSSSQQPSCPICFCEFEDEDDIIAMPCDGRHIFHRECVTSWLQKNQLCPMCRSNVVESISANSATQEKKGRKSSLDSEDTAKKEKRKNGNVSPTSSSASTAARELSSSSFAVAHMPNNRD